MSEKSVLEAVDGETETPGPIKLRDSRISPGDLLSDREDGGLRAWPGWTTRSRPVFGRAVPCDGTEVEGMLASPSVSSPQRYERRALALPPGFGASAGARRAGHARR